MSDRCDFFIYPREQCEDRDTRYIKDAKRHLCLPHLIRCGRNKSEWEEAGRVFDSPPTNPPDKTED